MSICVTRNEDGTYKVTEAPPTAYIAAAVIADPDWDVVAFRGGAMVIGEKVAYVPRAFDTNGNIICDKVPSIRRSRSPNHHESDTHPR